MTFLHIRYFCMVAECQSISRAAKALIVSQPALSKMIRSLEDELGVSLFLREGRKMMLTADGRFFYESAVNSLAILDNAVKYTSAGGSIQVRVRDWEMYLRIDVTDTGRGIPEHSQGTIFKRFYRDEAVHDIDGVGIGLYLAREIITMQGGYITVESKVGEGSTFSVFLPIK